MAVKAKSKYATQPLNLDNVKDQELRKALELVMANGYCIDGKSGKNPEDFLFKTPEEGFAAIGWDPKAANCEASTNYEKANVLYYKGWRIAQLSYADEFKQYFFSELNCWILVAGGDSKCVDLGEDDFDDEITYEHPAFESEYIYDSSSNFASVMGSDEMTVEKYKNAIAEAKRKAPLIRAHIDLAESVTEEARVIAQGIAAKMTKLNEKVKLKLEAINTKLNKEK